MHVVVPTAVRSINAPAVHSPAPVNANPGFVWAPQQKYWSGAFGGPSMPGAAMTAKIMGSIIHGKQIYQSYGVTPGSSGAKLLSNYGLRQVSCGTPGLVVIYGPSFGVVCAYPTDRIGAGNYDVNIYTQTIMQRS